MSSRTSQKILSPYLYYKTTNADYGASHRTSNGLSTGSRPLPYGGRDPRDVNNKRSTIDAFANSQLKAPIRGDHSIYPYGNNINGSTSRPSSGNSPLSRYSSSNNKATTSSPATIRRHGSSLQLDQGSSTLSYNSKTKSELKRNGSISNLGLNGSMSRTVGSDEKSSLLSSRGKSPRISDQILPGGKADDTLKTKRTIEIPLNDSLDSMESSRSNKFERRASRNDLPEVHGLNKYSSEKAKLQNGNSEIDGKSVKTHTNHTSDHVGVEDKLRDLSFKETSPSRFHSDSYKVTENIGTGLVGLQNIGNTCFMNSILQCLSNTKALRDFILSNSYQSLLNEKKSMVVKEYATLLNKMWKNDSSRRSWAAESPSNVKKAIKSVTSRFDGYSQHDAQEFLTYLLEGLHDGLNQVKQPPQRSYSESEDDKLSREDKAVKMWELYLKRDNSVIIDLFVGQLDSCLVCNECKYSSHAFDPFWSLPLPIPQGRGVRPVELQECFELFTQEEILDGDERPTCSKCKKRVKSTKRFKIQKFPQILIIHLKRFREGSYRSKLNTSIKFPLDCLDLSQFSADSGARVMYNLYAVSNHTGSTYGGHYTADCKHPDSRVWHHYNDTSVSDITPSALRESEAYILFYERDKSVGRKASIK